MEIEEVNKNNIEILIGLAFGQHLDIAKSHHADFEVCQEPSCKAAYALELELKGQEIYWVCEFCFNTIYGNELPTTWDLVWQTVVCPKCQRLVALDGGYAMVKVGAYADGKPDPRSSKMNVNPQ